MNEDALARLNAVYGARDLGELNALYAAWAAAYDSDVMRLGYQMPAMVAAMAARVLPPQAGPLLDCGAGTGMLGLLLAGLGFRDVTAIDMNEAMLQVARGRGCYRSCRRAVLGEALDFPDGAFAAALASGVFTAGHAPASAFAEIARVTRPGGFFVVGIREDGDHAAEYRAACGDLERQGRWRLEATSEPYRTFPLSANEAEVLNRVFVYRLA